MLNIWSVDARVGGHQLCGSWEFPLIYLLSFLVQIFMQNAAFHPFCNLRILVANVESLLMKSSKWFPGSSYCMLLSHSVFDDAIGSYEQMGFKRPLSQTGYRWCVGLVLSGAGIKWCSSTPHCFLYLCRVGSGRTAWGRGGLPQVCFKVILSHVLHPDRFLWIIWISLCLLFIYISLMIK